MPRHHLSCFAACALLLTIAVPADAETITLGSWNIENWHTNFEGHRLRQATRPATQPVSEQMMVVIRQEGFQNDEDHWEVSRVMLEDGFSPDVMVVQEGCRQNDLEFFNRRWLNNAYETVIQLPSNTDRNQHLDVLLKPGFKVIEKRDTYHDEEDVIPNERGNKLFARGPAFVLVESPGGYRFWVGNTHQKSKGGNNVEVTQWRNREATRTHAIMKELAAGDVKDVILLGDFNDEPGVGEFEAEGGGDTVANVVGPAEDGFVLVTQPLAGAREFSFGGYWQTRFRTLIDHAVVSPAMKDQVRDVKLIKTPLASVASDHYPLLVTIEADAPPSGTPQTGANAGDK